jgi:hypothetical protein
MQTQADTMKLAPAADIVTRVVELYESFKRALGSRVATRRNASIVATHVSRSAAPPEFLSVYLASIPFTNGDAWEVMR